MTKVPKLPSGRKRVWTDNAERQRAYRRRKSGETNPVTELPNPVTNLETELSNPVTQSETELSVVVAYDTAKSVILGVFITYEAAKIALEERRLERNRKAGMEVEWSEAKSEKGEWVLIYTSNPIYLKRQTAKH